MDRCSASRSSPQVPARIAVTTMMLTRGSTHVQPVRKMMSPESTTPAETTASPTMCKNALRMLRSCACEAAPRSHALPPLMSMPKPATIITVSPPTGCGSRSRCTASQAMAPLVNSSSTALPKAASTEARRMP